MGLSGPLLPVREELVDYDYSPETPAEPEALLAGKEVGELFVFLFGSRA